MGDIDIKPFQNTCKQKFSPDEAMVQASTLCSLWQDSLTDPNWHPFKVVTIDGDSQVPEYVFLIILFVHLNCLRKYGSKLVIGACKPLGNCIERIT